MNEKTVLTMAECMDLLGVSKLRIKQLIHEKELDPVYIKNPDMKSGRLRMITLASVARYSKNHQYLHN
ncbi:MAG: hypothetical protein IJI10_01430 [Eubacterium sp.]|nr:hypothetical protein [Eubacterium sp.]